jgi:hypothetical protein
MRQIVAVLCAMLTLALVAGGGQSVPKLRVEGRQFVDEAGARYIPRWVSGLTLLSRTPAQQTAFLDWAAKTGFTGVRVFAGALTWAPQTPEGARAALPGLLDRAAARGLVVEVTALTDTETGYDARAHLQGVVDILAGRRGVVLELANEVTNPTQSKALTPDRLRAWGSEIASPRGVVWAVGAGDGDAPVDGRYSTHGGSYITAHLDRGGDMWPQVSRVRVLFSIVETHGVPVINNEPMGADERPGSETGKQRWNDPAAFFALGVLDRAFQLGGVHHSQAGLMAELPGPVQQRCAAAYVAGHRAIEAVVGKSAVTFHDAGAPASPVASVDASRLSVAYAFTAGDRGVAVFIGVTGDPVMRLAAGWRRVRVAASKRAGDGTRIDVVEVMK